MVFNCTICIANHGVFSTRHISKLSEILLRQSPVNTTFHRHYRGRKSHNIGRVHGLEKLSVPELTKKQQGLWDPTKYQSTVPDTYDALNFTVSGFDMVLVENFTQFIHRTMIQHKQNIQEVYALPSNDVEVVKVTSAAQRRLESMELDTTLTLHKRVVQVLEMQSHVLSIILQLLMFHVPQTVQFSVLPHDEEQHAIRFQRKMELEKEKENLQILKDTK